MVEGEGGSPRRHDVFLSYSHGADGRLAPAVQRGLERLGARWPQTRALRVFRDTTGLSADASLWGAIEAALDGSEWFLLLASPDAAASSWVGRELEHWLGRNPAERLLVVLTEGDWGWDAAAGDLRGSAVPPVLFGRFADEPRHVDLRWARSEVDLDLHHARFRDAIAELAAPVHHVGKDELEGDHVRERRRVRRLTRLTIAALTCLALVASALAGVAWRQTSAARDQAQRASAQALAVRSQQLFGTRPDLAGLYAAESIRLHDQPAARAALIESINADPLLERIVPIEEPEVPAVLSRDGQLVVTQRPGGLAVRRADSGDLVRSIELSDGGSLPTTTERPPSEESVVTEPADPAATIPAAAAPDGASEGLQPTAVGFGLWPLIAIDPISDSVAVAGANGDPSSISVWPLDATMDGADAPTVLDVGDEVTELAWITGSTLLASVALDAPTPDLPEETPAALAGLRLIATETADVRAISEVDPNLQVGRALSESPASGRFLAELADSTVVMDAAGRIVGKIPTAAGYELQLTPDGQRVVRINRPQDPFSTNGVGLPTIQLLDVGTGEVLWSLTPEAYDQGLDGFGFGGAVNGLFAPRLPMSADGSRILVDGWMIGPAAGQDIVRLDPIGVDSPAWPTGSAPRSVALSSDGARLTRLVPSGIAHLNTAVLDVDCSRLAEITPLLPLRTEDGMVRPACSGEPAIDPIRLRPNESAFFATTSENGRHVAVLAMESGGESGRLLIVDGDTGKVNEVDLAQSLGEFQEGGGGGWIVLALDDIVVVLLAGNEASQAFWYSTTDGSLQAQRTFDGPAAVDPDKDRLLAGDGENLIEVDVDRPDDDTVLATWSKPIERVEAIGGFVLLGDSPSGESMTVFTPSGDRAITKLEFGEMLMAASPDESRIAINSARGVAVLDTASGRTVTRIEGSGPDSVAFVGDGLAVEFDKAVEYHDLDTGATSVLAGIEPQRDLGVEMVADGDRLLAFSGDGLRTYLVGGDLESVACTRAGRPLTEDEWEAVAAIGGPQACR